MAGPLAGLTGLYGPVDNDPHGIATRDPSNWGTPVDARHAIPGDSSNLPPRYDASPNPPDASMVGIEPGVSLTPGRVRDQTPRTHAAPWPRGVGLEPEVAQQASRLLHGVDFGGDTYLNDGPLPSPVEVEVVYDASPNASGLASGLPGQLKGLSTDVDQGYGQDNSLPQFSHGHHQARIYHDPIPFDITGLNTGDRPFYGKHPVRQNLLDGEDSPYGRAGDISTGMNLAPQPAGFPTPYQQAPNPTVAPVTGYDLAAPVPDFPWMAG